jgi:GMP synthase-like glutamine amidotransferase
MRPVAVLRFSPTEGPAYFADWLDARAIPWTLVPLDAGVRVPGDPRAFAGIAAMGGPMSAYDDLTWIGPVCALMREAVAAKVPVIGHCLGGQLLAQALGAEVKRARVPEIGWIDVRVTDRAAGAEWFGRRERFTTFEWHYDEFALPAGATRVLGNEFNANQGYVVDDRHIGLQCHIEMTRELVEAWLDSGATELPAVSSATEQSAADIRAALPARIPELNTVAADVYGRWARSLLR